MNSQKKSITLVLSDIPSKTTLRDLLDIFEKHGEISSVKITPRERDNKVSHIGFVTFEDAEEGRKYMNDNNNSVKMNDNVVSISFAKRRLGKRNDAFSKAGFHRTRVHVSGIPKEMTESELSEMLGNCKLYLPKDKKGYCFADYESEKEKNDIIMKLDGKMVDEKYELKIAPAFIGGRKEYYPRKKGGDKKKEQVMQ